MKISYLMIAGTAAFAIGTAATAQTQQEPSGQTGRSQELSRDQTQPSGALGGQRQEQGMQQQGMDSETIKQVQQALNDKGHDAGPVDGIMGPKTQQGLKDFQKAQGMRESGRLDQQTLSALGVQGQSSVGASGQRDAMGSAAGAGQPESGPSASGGATGTSEIPRSSESPAAGSSSMPSSGQSGTQSR
jgi:peptidoglycan hydrolase-like protein with peptidoglycan-binding domain